MTRLWTWAQVRREDEGLALRGWRHEEGERPHTHEFFELIIVVAGSARHETLDKTTALKRGDVLWVPAGVWHGFKQCRGFDIRMWLINPKLVGRDLGCLLVYPPWNRLLRGLAEHARARTHRVHVPELAAELEARWRGAHAASESAPEDWLRRRALLLETLALLGPRFASVSATDEFVPAAEHVVVRRCRHLLDHRFAEAWTLERLARESGGVHPSHLMRLFRATTGQTVLGYLTERRLHFAANLLLATALPVSEVAARCGWDDAAYFARRFRAKFRMAPGAFRGGGPRA